MSDIHIETEQQAHERRTADDDNPAEYYDPVPQQNGRAVQIWSYHDSGHDLSLEEQMFVKSYMIDRNEVAAMRRLGFDAETKRLRNAAQRYMSKVEVQDAIAYETKKLMDKLDITAEQVNRVAASIAFFDPREVMEWDHNGMKMMHSKFWSREQALNVAGIKVDKDGRVEVKFNDRMKANEFLAKQIGLVDDEAEQRKLMARAMADSAIDKMIEVAGRFRDARQPKVIENEG